MWAEKIAVGEACCTSRRIWVWVWSSEHTLKEQTSVMVGTCSSSDGAGVGAQADRTGQVLGLLASSPTKQVLGWWQNYFKKRGWFLKNGSRGCPLAPHKSLCSLRTSPFSLKPWTPEQGFCVGWGFFLFVFFFFEILWLTQVGLKLSFIVKEK